MQHHLQHAALQPLPMLSTERYFLASRTDRALLRVQHHLQHTALEFQEEKQHEMKVGLVNIISDTTTLTAFFIALATRNEGRTLLTNTIGRITQVRCFGWIDVARERMCLAAACRHVHASQGCLHAMVVRAPLHDLLAPVLL
jgi:hypothetical protein